MKLSEIRDKYPQYDDRTDQELADAFYDKFYSEQLDREDFYTRLGYTPEVAEEPVSELEETPTQVDENPTTPLVAVQEEPQKPEPIAVRQREPELDGGFPYKEPEQVAAEIEPAKVDAAPEPDIAYQATGNPDEIIDLQKQIQDARAKGSTSRVALERLKEIAGGALPRPLQAELDSAPPLEGLSEEEMLAEPPAEKKVGNITDWDAFERDRLNQEVIDWQEFITPSDGDGWAEIMQKTAENIPTRFKKIAGGMIQALGESLVSDVGASLNPGMEAALMNGSEALGLSREEYANLLKDNFISQTGEKIAGEAIFDLEANAPDMAEGSLPFYVSSTLGAVVEMVPALAGSLFTRNPNAGLAIMSGQVYGDQYAESRDQGRTPDEAQADAFVRGVLFEALPERLPLGVLTEMATDGRLLKILKSAGAEGLQEPVTQLLQVSYDAGIDPNDTVAEALQRPEVWAGVRDAAIIGMGAGGTLGAVTVGIEEVANRISTSESVDDAVLEAETILNEAEERSKLRVNDVPGVTDAPDISLDAQADDIIEDIESVTPDISSDTKVSSVQGKIVNREIFEEVRALQEETGRELEISEIQRSSRIGFNHAQNIKEALEDDSDTTFLDTETFNNEIIERRKTNKGSDIAPESGRVETDDVEPEIEPVTPEIETKTTPYQSVPDSAFNGDLEEGLNRVFLSDEFKGDSVELSGQGFTADETRSLESVGLAENGRMSAEQYNEWMKERGARLSRPSTTKEKSPTADKDARGLRAIREDFGNNQNNPEVLEALANEAWALDEANTGPSKAAGNLYSQINDRLTELYGASNRTSPQNIESWAMNYNPKGTLTVNPDQELGGIIDQNPQNGTWFAISHRDNSVVEGLESKEKAFEVIQKSNEVYLAGKEAATSPENNLPEPTQAQKEAGNYKMGKVELNGFDISIENPRGSSRSGRDPDGNDWSITMANDYGYIRRTRGADDSGSDVKSDIEHVDVFIGKDLASDKVFIVDQYYDGEFDEHKVMMGFSTEDQAAQAYLDNYDEGWEGLGDITEMNVEEFREWVYNTEKTSAPATGNTENAQQDIETETQGELTKLYQDIVDGEVRVEDAIDSLEEFDDLPTEVEVAIGKYRAEQLEDSEVWGERGDREQWDSEFIEVIAPQLLEDRPGIREAIIEVDYDAVTYPEGEGTTVAVFDTSNIVQSEASNKIKAHHGSPHSFSKFTTERIGTGEGAQAFGHGLYFAESEGVARSYRDNLGKGTGISEDDVMARALDARNGNFEAAAKDMRNRGDRAMQGENPEDASRFYRMATQLQAKYDPRGKVYTVELDVQSDELLDWDLPFKEQSELVQKALKDMQGSGKRLEEMSREEIIAVLEHNDPDGDYSDAASAVQGMDPLTREEALELATEKEIDEYRFSEIGDNQTGKSIYRQLTSQEGGGNVYSNPAQARVSARLLELGVKGTKYKDGFSRGKEGDDGTYNYVIFSEDLVNIVSVDGVEMSLSEVNELTEGMNDEQIDQFYNEVFEGESDVVEEGVSEESQEGQEQEGINQDVEGSDTVEGSQEASEPKGEVKLKSNGDPFASEKSARASKVFKNADNARVVEVEGGYGVEIIESFVATHYVKEFGEMVDLMAVDLEKGMFIESIGQTPQYYNLSEVWDYQTMERVEAKPEPERVPASEFSDYTKQQPLDEYGDYWFNRSLHLNYTNPEERVLMERVVKESGEVLSLNQADARILEWEAEMDRQRLSGENRNKIVISLFDETGTWANPWALAGYDVRKVDLASEGVNVFDIDMDWLLENGFVDDDVHMVLAACPCTEFSVAGNRYKPGGVDEKQGAQAKQDQAVALVQHTLRVINAMKPRYWAIENPVGTIQKLSGLPDARLSFHPSHFGFPYTKKTMIWGNFNADLPTANVDNVKREVDKRDDGYFDPLTKELVPTPLRNALDASKAKHIGGSWAFDLRGDVPEHKRLRSATPEGFSYAFFMANSGASIETELEQEAMKLARAAASDMNKKQAAIEIPKLESAFVLGATQEEDYNSYAFENDLQRTMAGYGAQLNSEFELNATDPHGRNQAAIEKAQATFEKAEPVPIVEPTLTEKPKAKKKSTVLDTTVDSALILAAKKGGLNADSFIAEGLDPESVKDKSFNNQVFGNPIFRKNGGMTPDGFAELLQQWGYVPSEISANEALDIALNEANGIETKYHPDGIEQQIEAEIAAMKEQPEQDYDANDYEDLTDGMSEEQVPAFNGIVEGDLWDLAESLPQDPNYQEVYDQAYEEYSGGFELTQQTPEEIQAAEQEAQALIDAQRAEEAKAAADEAIGDFTLTGSDSTADIAAAQGQTDLWATIDQIDASQYDVMVEVVAEDTGDVYEMPQNAEKALRRLRKKRDTVQSILECIRG